MRGDDPIRPGRIVPIPEIEREGLGLPLAVQPGNGFGVQVETVARPRVFPVAERQADPGIGIPPDFAVRLGRLPRRGLQADDGILVGKEFRIARLRRVAVRRHGEEPVVGARPAPVEIDIVLPVVSGGHESVAAAVPLGSARHVNGSSGLQFLLQQVDPLLGGIEFPVDEPGVLVVVHVGLQGRQDILRISAGTGRRILHLDHVAAVAHQRGHLVPLFVGPEIGSTGRHPVPQVGVSQGDTLHGDGPPAGSVGVGRNRTPSFLRIFPVPQDDGHRRGHAAGQRPGTLDPRAEQVVRAVLAPECGFQQDDGPLRIRFGTGRCRGSQSLPARTDGRKGRPALLAGT